MIPRPRKIGQEPAKAEEEQIKIEKREQEEEKQRQEEEKQTKDKIEILVKIDKINRDIDAFKKQSSFVEDVKREIVAATEVRDRITDPIYDSKIFKRCQY